MFGRDAIHVSTAAIKSDDPGTYASLEDRLQNLVTRRDVLAGQMLAQLDKIPGCGGLPAVHGEDEGATSIAGRLDRLNQRGELLLDDMRRLDSAAGQGNRDDSRFDSGN